MKTIILVLHNLCKPELDCIRMSYWKWLKGGKKGAGAGGWGI